MVAGPLNSVEYNKLGKIVQQGNFECQFKVFLFQDSKI